MLAVWAGWPIVLAPAVPLAVDGTALVAARMWIDGGRGKRWGQVVAIAALMLSMAANALHAHMESPLWFAPILGALIPASLWVVLHMMSLPVDAPKPRSAKPARTREVAERIDRAETPKATDPVPDTANNELPAGQWDTWVAELAALRSEAEQAGTRVPGKTHAMTTYGLTERKARRLADEAAQHQGVA